MAPRHEPSLLFQGCFWCMVYLLVISALVYSGLEDINDDDLVVQGTGSSDLRRQKMQYQHIRGSKFAAQTVQSWYKQIQELLHGDSEGDVDGNNSSVTNTLNELTISQKMVLEEEDDSEGLDGFFSELLKPVLRKPSTRNIPVELEKTVPSSPKEE